MQDARVNYNNAQSSYVQAVYNYNVARATLEREIALPQENTLTVEDVKDYQGVNVKTEKSNLQAGKNGEKELNSHSERNNNSGAKNLLNLKKKTKKDNV